MSKNLWWLIPLLLLITVDYRIDIGPLSIAVVEPLVLLVAAGVLLPKIVRREPIQWRHPLFLLFAGMTAWALLIRPFSPDWKHGLSDIRDWLLPTLLLFTLINAKRESRAQLTAFVIVLLFNSAFALLQSFSDNDQLRPFIHPGTIYKRTLTGESNASFGVAFFSAPNGLGLYLVLAIPFLYAWLRINWLKYGAVRYALLLLPISALYFSYSRTSLVIFIFVVVVLVLDALIKNTAAFVRAVMAVIALGALVSIVALTILPRMVVQTLWWRLALWEIAGITLREYPSIWLLGNGIDRFIPLSFYPQPHNLFVFMLLEYGVVGILFTVAIIVLLVYSGLRARANGVFERHPVLAPLWIGTLSIFLIAMTETVWLAINTRLLFAFSSALYLAFLTEADPSWLKVPRWRLPTIAAPKVGAVREHRS